MKKLSKKLLSVLTAAAMIFTVLATPIGEILGFTGEAVKASAAVQNVYPKWQTIDGVTTIRCTYYAWQEAYERTGVALPNFGNGGSWYNAAKNAGYDVGTEARANSIAVYRGSTYGHVAYVVSVDGDKMTLNQGGISGVSGAVDGVLLGNKASTKIGSKQWSSSQNTLYGFIYLNIDLTSSPSNLGTTFTAPIKVTSTGKVLTAGADGNVTVQTWTGADNQRWIFTKNSSDNYYEIRNGQYYQKVLDVSNGSDKDGANLQIWEDNDTASQRFGIYGSQGNYVIKVKYSSGRVIDSDGGDNNVHMWTYYPDLAVQEFTISPEPTTRFDTFSATNITNNDARVKCMAYKRSEDKAVKYGVVYAPADTWNVTSSRKSFYSAAAITNVGSTYREIYFDFGSEIGDTLKPDTTYNYYFVAVYNMDGVNMTFSSSVQSFKTTNSCTHTFGSWVTKTAATCTADGLKQRTCSKCGKVESATITKLGHSYTSSVTKAATCTTTGVRTYKCSRCTSSYTESIAKIAHSYTSSITTQPTCTTTGIRTYKCSGCSASYTESIAKTGHSYTTGYEAAHPHKNYKKCTVCSTVEYTGTTQYLCSCLSCTNLVAPTITVTTSQPNINKAVTFSWVASPKDKLAGYWVQIAGPDGKMFKTISISKDVNSYTFTPTMTGEYKIAIAATPTGSTEGAGCVWANKTVKVHDYVTYTIKSTYTSKGFDHHLCSQCSAEYKDNYTSGTKAIPSTPFTVTATSKSVKLSIPTTPFIEGYVITRKCNGVVDKETTVTDPAYYSFDITGFNTGRGANELIVYTRSGRYAETNTYGIEIVVDANGYVIGERAYGSEVKSIVPEGGFVASMHNASSQFADIAIGDRVEYDMADKILTVYYTAKTIENVTYTDTTTEPGKTYTYTVTPYVKEFKGATTEKTVTIAPSAVVGFKSPSRSTSAIRLNWTKNANADGYVIEQFNGSAWEQIADVTDNSTTTYKVTGLKSGTAYKFRMKAYSVTKYGDTIYGDKTETLTANTQASAVTGLALKSRSASALRLTWTKNTAVDGYIIEQKIDGEWTEIAVIEDYKTTEYKVTGLNASAKYSFRMKAYAITKYGDKTYSGYTSTLSKTTSPANVTGLKIGGRAGTALRLNWNKNTSADGYIIEQYKGGKWTQIADITDNATTTYRIDGLSPATQYKFRVRAYNMVGATALYSNYTATLAAYTNPSAVSGLKIAGKAGTALRLGWTQNTTADGYIIEQYIDGKWTRIARIAGNETLSYRVENLTKATTYKFRVATYNIEDNVAYYGAYVSISGTTL